MSGAQQQRAQQVRREQRLQEQARYWAQTKSAVELEALRQGAPTPELAKYVRLAQRWRHEIEQIERAGVVWSAPPQDDMDGDNTPDVSVQSCEDSAWKHPPVGNGAAGADALPRPQRIGRP